MTSSLFIYGYSDRLVAKRMAEANAKAGYAPLTQAEENLERALIEDPPLGVGSPTPRLLIERRKQREAKAQEGSE